MRAGVAAAVVALPLKLHHIRGALNGHFAISELPLKYRRFESNGTILEYIKY